MYFGLLYRLPDAGALSGWLNYYAEAMLHAGKKLSEAPCSENLPSGIVPSSHLHGYENSMIEFVHQHGLPISVSFAMFL